MAQRKIDQEFKFEVETKLLLEAYDRMIQHKKIGGLPFYDLTIDIPDSIYNEELSFKIEGYELWPNNTYKYEFKLNDNYSLYAECIAEKNYHCSFLEKDYTRTIDSFKELNQAVKSFRVMKNWKDPVYEEKKKVKTFSF